MSAEFGTITRYTSVDEADVAYQVVGDGPIDLVYFHGLGQIDLRWDDPYAAAFRRALSSFTRLLLFDRRGSGASDPVVLQASTTWESWVDDLRAVLDAVGSEHAAVFGEADAGPIAMLFAAIHPDRVSHLILANTTARFLADDDYPIGVSADLADSVVGLVRRSWGTAELARIVAPAAAEDDAFVDRFARMQRAAATPRTAAAQYEYVLRDLDVRSVLPLIQVPTLVLHSEQNPFVPITHGRYLAEHIPGARLIETAGADVGFTSLDPLDDVAEFLTGQRGVSDIDRVLTSVLFTDIASSTGRAASVGDKRWVTLLDAHGRMVREHLVRWGGREVNTTGDGFVAAFDRPMRAVRCAEAIVAAAVNLGIEVRAGVHTGECETRGDDLGGLAVHIAARVAALAAPSEVLVSSTVRDLLAGGGMAFTERGEHELKGVPGPWKLFTLGRTRTRSLDL